MLVALLAQHTASGNTSGPLSLAAVVALAALAPFILLVGTSFVKISVVLGVARNALGTPQVPSNTVVMALSAILTLHVMAPTVSAIADATEGTLPAALGADPSTEAGREALSRAWQAARGPVARFLRANATARDRALFLDLARQARARQGPTSATAPAADDLSVLLPAFLVSELTRAFLLAFLVFLPFLVVDLVIANLLAAMGLQGLSPHAVALPFKLLLFVLSDGWYLLSRALVLGYR